MQTWVSTAIAGDVIEQIFYHLEQNLRKNQQQGRVISYLTSQVLFCIHSIWDIASLQASVNQSRKMNEDMLKDIPHLNKDTLMPKELTKQQQAINLQNRSNISITSLGLKKSSNRTSNNILSLSMKPRSLVVKNQRVQKKSKQKESALIILKSNRQMQDPQIEQLRGRTETRLENEYQYRKMQLQHQKSFKDKSQLLASFLSQEPVAALTHDYDGQQIKSIQGDEKIKHYSMRTGISPSNVNAKDNNRTLQPLQCQVLSQKYSSKERPYRNLKPMEMPFFQQKKLQIKMNGIETYKMNEYRKRFGRGYSRMDNLNKTIEYTPAKEQEDPFYQKRHLVDTLQTSVVGSTSARNGCMARRLALPKLHGRYKVLDRYEQQ